MGIEHHISAIILIKLETWNGPDEKAQYIWIIPFILLEVDMYFR